MRQAAFVGCPGDALPRLGWKADGRKPLELAGLLLATVGCSALVFQAPSGLGSAFSVVALTFPFLLM